MGLMDAWNFSVANGNKALQNLRYAKNKQEELELVKEAVSSYEIAISQLTNKIKDLNVYAKKLEKEIKEE